MLNPRRDPDLLSLGATTDGVVSLDACRGAGLTDRRLSDLVATGRWQSPLPRVYITFSGPLPSRSRLWAAVLYAGKDATISHASAGFLWRLTREPPFIHVSVPYDRDADDQPGLRVHRSRTLRPEDSHPRFAPRRTTVERTVLDLLAEQATATGALALVADAIRDRLTTPEKVRVALDERRRTRCGPRSWVRCRTCMPAPTRSSSCETPNYAADMACLPELARYGGRRTARSTSTLSSRNGSCMSSSTADSAMIGPRRSGGTCEATTAASCWVIDTCDTGGLT